MRALRAHTRGGPERLVVEQAPVPVLADDEVLIAVYAAGITFAELDWDLSWTTRAGRDRTPVIPSHEVSGVVTKVGAGVTGFTEADEVYGLIDFDRNGAAAEYATAPAAAIARKPSTVSHTEAAALPLAALTAWQALVDHAELKPGERVLVHGGAGGVGVYAVQIAAGLGAHVTATDIPAHADFVRRLGAESFIDFTSRRFDEVAGDMDVVLDTVGGETLRRSYGVLRAGGRVVTLGGDPGDDRAIFFVVRPDTAQLAHLAALVDDKQLRPIVSQTFPLEAGRQAYESSRRPREPGKTVLVVR